MSVRLLLAALLLSANVLAQAPAALIANIAGRSTFSLNGSWHAIPDQYDVGALDYRGKPLTRPFFANAKPRDKSELVEYSFERSELLKVPGDWNSQRPSLFLYEGTVWYEKTFSYKKTAGKRVFLHIGAANYQARVGMNGKVICEHEGGFTSFNCEVTAQLRDGDNFVVIYVNNTRKPEGVPPLMTDWWNYGGLTRDVQLVEVPERFIQDYALHLQPGTRDQITGWVKLSDASAGRKVTVRIPEISLEKSFTTDASGTAKISLPATALKLWSPEQPRLYRVEIVTMTDKVAED